MRLPEQKTLFEYMKGKIKVAVATIDDSPKTVEVPIQQFSKLPKNNDGKIYTDPYIIDLLAKDHYIFDMRYWKTMNKKEVRERFESGEWHTNAGHFEHVVKGYKGTFEELWKAFEENREKHWRWFFEQALQDVKKHEEALVIDAIRTVIDWEIEKQPSFREPWARTTKIYEALRNQNFSDTTIKEALDYLIKQEMIFTPTTEHLAYTKLGKSDTFETRNADWNRDFHTKGLKSAKESLSLYSKLLACKFCHHVKETKNDSCNCSCHR